MASFFLAFVPAAPPAGAQGTLESGIDVMEHQTVFQSAAVDWRWIVYGDATFEDGGHVDTGNLHAAIKCLSDGRCTHEFTFVGGLGTATCSQSGGVLTGAMELYAGPSFQCAYMALDIVGDGACEANLNTRAHEMGSHRLAGNGGGIGVCIAP